MNIPRSEDGEETVINTSSLVDIMFILIIFFLVTTSFARQERDILVNLPETDTTLSSAVKVLVINVREDGVYFLGDQRLNLAELKAALNEAAQENPGQKVLVRGDREARHGEVASAIAACRSAGIYEANIGYMSSTEGG
ncbi:MAG: ExbD/TolR family protein [Opitutales bacterium]